MVLAAHSLPYTYHKDQVAHMLNTPFVYVATYAYMHTYNYLNRFAKHP